MPHRLAPVARKLRNDATSAERKLWLRLRREQVSGFKFRIGDARTLVVGTPNLDYLRGGINDPILWGAIALEDMTLRHAIVSR